MNKYSIMHYMAHCSKRVGCLPRVGEIRTTIRGLVGNKGRAMIRKNSTQIYDSPGGKSTRASSVCKVAVTATVVFILSIVIFAIFYRTDTGQDALPPPTFPPGFPPAFPSYPPSHPHPPLPPHPPHQEPPDPTFCLDGYWPLCLTEPVCDGLSPSQTSHQHVLQGTTYYMPDGLAGGQFGHGESPCPVPPNEHLCIAGYWPLCVTEALCDTLSPTESSYQHIFNGTIYYMPSGLPPGTFSLGNGPCPSSTTEVAVPGVPPGSCEDSCGGEAAPSASYASDGACDDGGPGSEYAQCAYAHDCTDCGPRR